jgi:imidazolonepropionase-like amidohydrolase
MKPTVLKALLLTAGMACSAAALAASTLIQDVRVFDGRAAHEHRSVLVVDGLIADADFRGPVPQGARVVSGAGRTLLPGLIDSHVHAYQHLDLPLLFGVTTQVDMFTGVKIMQDITRAMAEGKNQHRADLFSAGTLVTARGGHGTEYGLSIPTLDSAADAQAFVDARIAEGSHFIKIVMEEGLGQTRFNSLDVATVKAVIEAAHRRGKLAVVHITTPANARAALEAGADGLVHLFNGVAVPAAEADGLAQLAKARGAFVIPTFSVLESMAGLKPAELLADASFAALLDKEQQAPLLSAYGPKPIPGLLAAPKAVTAALRKAGVQVLAGTDAGNSGTQYGISLHHELAALVDAGLTPAEALAAATSAPADAFRLGKRGRVANGYKADLLLVEGNPLTDIAATRRMVEVWKDGATTTQLLENQRLRVAKAAQDDAQALELPAEGRISLFSDGKLASPIGAGWMASHDSMMGGRSSVVLNARGDKDRDGVLTVEAQVNTGFAYPWAGVAFMPGAGPMQPANLSRARVIRFKVRGDGQQYQFALASRGVGIPRARPFTAGPEWTEVTMPLSDFAGIDPAALTMIGFNAGPKPGAYRFEIADVRLLER